MAELKEGQHIIFKHPESEGIRTGRVSGGSVLYHNPLTLMSSVPVSAIQEWCDAEAAFNAWGLQQVRTGDFEWNEGPTVEP